MMDYSPRSCRGADWTKNIAIDAVKLADALITELDKAADQETETDKDAKNEN